METIQNVHIESLLLCRELTQLHVSMQIGLYHMAISHLGTLKPLGPYSTQFSITAAFR